MAGQRLQDGRAVVLHALGEVDGLAARARLPHRQRLVHGCRVRVLVAQDVQLGQDLQVSHLQGGT